MFWRRRRRIIRRKRRRRRKRSRRRTGGSVKHCIIFTALTLQRTPFRWLDAKFLLTFQISESYIPYRNIKEQLLPAIRRCSVFSHLSLLQVTASSVRLSVCPSVHVEQLRSCRTDLQQILCLEVIVLTSVQTLQLYSKP
jgi:hypothetical protein